MGVGVRVRVGMGVGVSVVVPGSTVGWAASVDTGSGVGERSLSRSFSLQASSRGIDNSKLANVCFMATTPSSRESVSGSSVVGVKRKPMRPGLDRVPMESLRVP